VLTCDTRLILGRNMEKSNLFLLGYSISSIFITFEKRAIDPSSPERRRKVSSGIWATSKKAQGSCARVHARSFRRGPFHARPYGRRRCRSLFSSRIAPQKGIRRVRGNDQEDKEGDILGLPQNCLKIARRALLGFSFFVDNFMIRDF